MMLLWEKPLLRGCLPWNRGIEDKAWRLGKNRIEGRELTD